MSTAGLLEELAYKLDQVQRYRDYIISEIRRVTAMGGYTPGAGAGTGPLDPSFIFQAEEPQDPKLSDAERAKCPLCQAVVGLNRNSPFLAYNDSPRVKHLMDVHKRSLEEAQALIKKYLG